MDLGMLKAVQRTSRLLGPFIIRFRTVVRTALLSAVMLGEVRLPISLSVKGPEPMVLAVFVRATVGIASVPLGLPRPLR